MLQGRVVLVVEDEPLVGLDIAAALKSKGAHVLAAHTVAHALTVVDRVKLSAAVLDIKLNGGDCSPVCERLSQRGIPFAFYTGYSNALNGWANAPIITKPALDTQIVDTVAALCNGHAKYEAP